MQSKSEVKVGKALQKRGFTVLYQHQVGRYAVDIYLPELNVSVEVHGPHHVLVERIARDQRRSRFIYERGIREYIISADDANVAGRVRELVTTIEKENHRQQRRYQFNDSLKIQLEKCKDVVCSTG